MLQPNERNSASIQGPHPRRGEGVRPSISVEFGLKAHGAGAHHRASDRGRSSRDHPHMKRAGRVWIRIFPDVPVSKKPAEVRMGSGKGSPELWVARVKPGRIIFEIDGVTAADRQGSAAARRRQAADQDAYRRAHRLTSWPTRKLKTYADDDDQLDDAVLKLKKEQFNLRFQRASGQLENTSRIREVRRDIARVMTIAAPTRAKTKKSPYYAEAYPAGRGRIRQERQDGGSRVERRFTHPLLKKTCDVRRSTTRTTSRTPQDRRQGADRGDRAGIEEETLDGGPGRPDENRLRFVRPGRTGNREKFKALIRAHQKEDEVHQ